MIRIIKFLIGLILIPACVAATIVFKDEVFLILKTEVYFFAGIFSYLVLLAVFQQPIRTYVFGHELTHAVWVWFSGGRVKGFKATASGGEIRATKSNFLICLAPYFFPLYSLMAIVIFLALKVILPHPPGRAVLGFVLGLTWAFHITFTIYVLLQGQPDVGTTGRVFSIPFIYLTNVLVLAALIIFYSPRLSANQFFPHLLEGTKKMYQQIWLSAPGFFESCLVHFRQLQAALGF